jgi:hypothetical protein
MSDIKRKDVSIEYCHIYTNNKIEEEQNFSLEILGQLKKELARQVLSLVVLVDDYSFPDPTFDYNQFYNWLKQHDNGPDLVFRESQLIPLCDQVIENLTDGKLKEQLVDYVKAKKYPCSLFIAAWYLLRLGYLEYFGFDKVFCANRLINILPESFKPFEDKALEIISATKFAGAEKLIEYRYTPGRLIA